MVKAAERKILADISECMHVGGARLRPAVELDTELDRALGGAQEIRLIDPQGFVQNQNRRDRRFAHPDRADLLGFDQGDVNRVAENLCDEAGGDPARGATTRYHDIRNAPGAHGVCLLPATTQSAAACAPAVISLLAAVGLAPSEWPLWAAGK